MTLKWTPEGYLKYGIGCLSGPKKTKEKGSTNGSTFTPFTMNSGLPMLLILKDTKGPMMPVAGIQYWTRAPILGHFSSYTIEFQRFC